MNRASRLLAASLFVLPVSGTQTPMQLAPFNSIEVSDGAHVMLRHGPAERVTLVKGSLDYSRVEVTDRGTLVVQKCRGKCPRGYELEVEISLPGVNRISLANSGIIQSRGSFPRRDELIIAVAHGGTIDVRSMPAWRVVATVEQGGRILTVPEAYLAAQVRQGGVITYWGEGEVKSAVEHGGVVHKGSTDEINLPFSEFRAPLMRKHR